MKSSHHEHDDHGKKTDDRGIVGMVTGWYVAGLAAWLPACSRKHCSLLYIVILFLASWVLSGVPSVALAQIRPDSQSETRNTEIGAVVDRLRRLERDITTLQKQVYGGRGSGQIDREAGLDPGSDPSQGTPHSVAWMEERFASLEEQLRRLTNMIEEVDYRTRQTQNRLQIVSDDTALRLDTLEDHVRTLTKGRENPPGDSSLTPPLIGETAEADQAGVLGQLRVPVPQKSVQGNASGNNATRQPDNPGNTAHTDSTTSAQEEGSLLPAALPQEQYDFAVELLWEADYSKAERALREFIRVNPENTLVGNAQYWLGETYYARKDYTQSAVIFAEGYKKYQKSQKGPDFLLKLALSLSQIDESQQACRALAELESVFPNAQIAIKNRAERERKSLECPAS